MIGDKWERTKDIQGHRALFSIKCRHCELDMELFDSRITDVHGQIDWAPRECNRMVYKCPECGAIAQFDITDKHPYLQEIVHKRKMALKPPQKIRPRPLPPPTKGKPIRLTLWQRILKFFKRW